ncbi:orange carotenoid protein N-terminal domain-containing protein [Tolypothrix sp. VBCCA 56010]|uniref:orange carotenoid protein N-terminal domain-containing protein n=1 Tax=Tolypothrix sp. VBCCA 56010 TaxID=3137731 RepID=UPI003D7C882F
MTSTNVNPSQQAVSAFQRLKIDDRLAVLGSLLTSFADKIPANVTNSLPREKAAELVAQVQKLSSEEQLFALRDLLPADRRDQDEVMLDPNPSKAMAELAHGGNKISTGEYGNMQPEGKLAFWYLVAERLRTVFMVSNQSQPSQQATEVLNSLKSFNTDDLVSFLKKVL